jgi:hypothetical protein
MDGLLAMAAGEGQWDRCLCGPDVTGEDIDINPDCPQHGTEHDGANTAMLDPNAEAPY